MREDRVRPERYRDDPNCEASMPMACRENSRVQLDRLIAVVEKKLEGLRKMQKLAELASDDPTFEALLYTMVQLYRSVAIGQEA